VRRALPLLVSVGLVATVLVPYLALGGGSYEPSSVADPWVGREWRDPGGLQEGLAQVFLSALDGTACELGVSREDLVLAVRDEDSLDTFAEANGLTRTDAERALQDGLRRAVDDAEEAGALPGFVASLARRAIESVPPWLLLDALDSASSLLP
jgi:hypothetical protein